MTSTGRITLISTLDGDEKGLFIRRGNRHYAWKYFDTADELASFATEDQAEHTRRYMVKPHREGATIRIAIWYA